MIRYNDYHLGRLILKLKEEGLYENSLIIVTADHGESFGEHKWILKKPTFGHSGVVYEEVIKVPLIVKYPQNKFAGKRYSTPVQLVDIYPTILDIGGIKANEIEIEGQSLNPLSFSASQERIIFTESQIDPFGIHSASVRIGDKKLIKVDTRFYFGKNLKKIARNILEKLQIPSIQFYDLSSDPKEQRNLARKRKKDTKYFLEKYYEIIEKCDEKAKPFEKEQEKIALNEEVKKRLKSLGYFND
jgi:arylsulfatase A-like enzyme